MKILIVSAGTKKSGATARAAKEASDRIKFLGECCEEFVIPYEPLATCTGCGVCKSTNRCIHNDKITELSDRLCEFDAFIFFSPVHYGGASGAMKSALSRLFFSKKSELEYKPASVVTVSRRGGNITASEEISRFFSFASMPYISGNYPGIIHGTSGDEAELDKEGLQTIRSIAENMVWIVKCIEAGKKVGIDRPISEAKIKTSYIR